MITGINCARNEFNKKEDRRKRGGKARELRQERKHKQRKLQEERQNGWYPLSLLHLDRLTQSVTPGAAHTSIWKASCSVSVPSLSFAFRRVWTQQVHPERGESADYKTGGRAAASIHWPADPRQHDSIMTLSVSSNCATVTCTTRSTRSIDKMP